MLKFHSNCYTEVSLMVRFQFDYLFLMSSLKLGLLDLVLNFLLSGRGEGDKKPSKYLLLQGLTSSENWVMVRHHALMRLLFPNLTEINILKWWVLLENVSLWELTLLEGIFPMWNFFAGSEQFLLSLCWLSSFLKRSVYFFWWIGFYTRCIFFLFWRACGIKITKTFYSVYPKCC